LIEDQAEESGEEAGGDDDDDDDGSEESYEKDFVVDEVEEDGKGASSSDGDSDSDGSGVSVSDLEEGACRTACLLRLRLCCRGTTPCCVGLLLDPSVPHPLRHACKWRRC
jgi:hypothetical protein